MEKKIKLWATLETEFDYCVEDAIETIESFDVKDFIKKYHEFKKECDGTYIRYVLRDEKDFAIVMGETEEGEIAIKLAYNCDDMQCDYNMDWYLPTCNEEGEVSDDFETYIYDDSDIENALNYFKNHARDYFEYVVTYGV